MSDLVVTGKFMLAPACAALLGSQPLNWHLLRASTHYVQRTLKIPAPTPTGRQQQFGDGSDETETRLASASLVHVQLFASEMLSVVRGLRQPVALHVRALSSSSPFIGNALPGVCCGGSHCAVAAGVPAAPAPADDLWRRVADAVTRGAARCGDALESLLSDNTLLAVPKRKVRSLLLGNAVMATTWRQCRSSPWCNGVARRRIARGICFLVPPANCLDGFEAAFRGAARLCGLLLQRLASLAARV
jgi:hypothetical protein